MRGPEGQDRHDDETRADRTRAGRARVAALVAVAAALPLGVVLVVLREPRWYPAMDYALVELLVRDVGSSDPPLGGERGGHAPVAVFVTPARPELRAEVAAP